MSANIGLLTDQQFYSLPAFQNGGHTSFTRFSRAKRFITKIDLKDAYVVVLLHKQSHKYLMLQHHGTVYQYKALAFGMSVSLRIFSILKKMAYPTQSPPENSIK